MKKILSLIVLIMTFSVVGCIYIEEPPIGDTITITGEEEVIVGQTIFLTVNTNDEVQWVSSDETIATVDEFGVVTGVFVGQADVVVVKINEPSNTASHTINVVLEDEEPVPQEPIFEEELDYYHTKILSIDTNNRAIELLNVPSIQSKLVYSEDVKVYQLLGEELTPITIEDLYIGLENVYVAVGKDTKEIRQIILDGEIGFSNIRVGIRRSIGDIADQSTLYHDQIVFSTSGATIIQTFDGSLKQEVHGGTINITVSNNMIRVTRNNLLVLVSNKRVLINSDNPIAFSSISRGLGTPSYEGTLEVSLVNNRLLVVNDVNLESYLTKVVPSEMPASFHIEALKAQAIAARTYAYMDIFNKSHDHLGYTVDDSISSQVYNNSNTHQTTTQAVLATAGIVMLYDGTPIRANYYSTSSGLTAHGHEVWITTGPTEEIPYLLGQNLSYVNGEQLNFDYTSEASMLDFFKTIRVDTPDIGATLHRWRIEMNKTQLRNTLNVNLPISYANNPESILTKVSGQWVSQPIPSSIGDIVNFYVSERGTSGVVISVVVDTTTGSYKIVNQYNIRFTIRPRDAGSTVPRQNARNASTNYTFSGSNDSVLFSGFFAIETVGNTYVFYGGGNGHGVGMSQWGAHGLGQQGFDSNHILTTYYSNIDLEDIAFNYNKLPNYKEVFNFVKHLH